MTTSSDDILAGLLAECSDSILAGITVKACLDRHPQHATALEPLLTILVDVHELRAVPVRSSMPAARTREQFMAAAMRLAEERRTPPVTGWERLAAWWAGIVALFVPPAGSRTPGMPVGLLAAMLVVILAGVLVTGGITVSAKSLPGDLLYPIKTSSERVRLFIRARPDGAQRPRAGILERRRRHEAQAVAEQGRRVANLSLDGTIEEIHDNRWKVSGLDLTLDPALQIIGNPVVGARVHGVLRAPGDGRLILIYAEVEDPAGNGASAPAATATATATPTRPAATATATATATIDESAVSGAAAPGLPDQRWREPEGWAPALPTATNAPTRVPTATGTPAPTATPAAPPTVTLAPTRTDMPPPRVEPLKHRIEGWIESIEGDIWIISGIPVRVSGATQIIGNLVVGSKVSASVVAEADGSWTALNITVLAPPEATPEPVEFTDILQKINGEWWTIGSTAVRVLGDTTIEGDPQIGDLVSVKGERHQSEVWALRIAVIRLTEVQFEDIISAVSGSSLVVGGYTVLIDSQTQIIGTPEVGRVAQVAAAKMPDDRLIGKVIMVLDPTPTPTVTATQPPEPTATSTLEPTPTLTPEPTSPPNLDQTATLTPELTATPTLEPTPEPTSTLEVTASPSPVSGLRCAKIDA